MKTVIRKIIMDAIEEVNEQLEDDVKITYLSEAKLIGMNAIMDSMTFVTLITIIEELISDEVNQNIQLVTDKAFSRERSPFYSFSSLEDFIEEVVKEGK